ncbi:MAG: virulence protein RhuM/Fic/DOC family protein [Candidatus Moranbacteria bacterium]|nr:virulence protein RhuM/Fic/DOC family protein [Candidatus Moranbacteria bacterium]
MKKQEKKGVVIYQAKSGAIELRGDFGKETMWASLDQIADLFGRDKSVISRHIKNIFKDGELQRDSVVAFFATTAADGKTYNVEYFDLDMILSVGYRVNSKTATRFRQWATKTLREHIVKGYTINRSRIAKNYDAFLASVESVKKLLPAGGAVDAESALELVRLFASTWFSLDAYDRSTLPKSGATKRQVRVTGADLSAALGELKGELLSRKEATDIFGEERQKEAATGIIGNVLQSFGGKDLYPTVEEKAAHLLYFMVKNHPFVDGNKRSGAFAFVWFLRKARVLDATRLTPEALTALTLLVAESDPKDKDRVTALVVSLIRG